MVGDASKPPHCRQQVPWIIYGAAFLQILLFVAFLPFSKQALFGHSMVLNGWGCPRVTGHTIRAASPSTQIKG